MSCATYARSTLLILPLLACQAAEWTLPPISGHGPNVWKDGRNWTQDLGNPQTDTGATWGLYYQAEVDAPFQAMGYGQAYGYNFVWRSTQGSKMANGGEDPLCMYIDTKLYSPSSTVFPGDGPAAMVTFAAPAIGTYKVIVDCAATVQQPTAGNALVRLLVVDAAQKTVREISTVELNKAGGHGAFPEATKIDQRVELKGGERLAVTVQARNPGPATCGRGVLAITNLTVSTLP